MACCGSRRTTWARSRSSGARSLRSTASIRSTCRWPAGGVMRESSPPRTTAKISPSATILQIGNRRDRAQERRSGDRRDHRSRVWLVAALDGRHGHDLDRVERDRFDRQPVYVRRAGGRRAALCGNHRHLGRRPRSLHPRRYFRSETYWIVLKNGDRVTGEITDLEYGLLRLSTDDMGTISIEWSAIASIDSQYTFDVQVAGGRRYAGIIATSDDGQDLSIRDDT